jgi:hypothetical protein
LLLTSISACSGESEKSQPEKVAILDKAERIDLYSLEPVPENKPEKTLRGCLWEFRSTTLSFEI